MATREILLILELVIGVEPTTCWLQVSCSAIEPHQQNLYKLLWRPGRDSNPRPPAWQAGILTSWTTRPHKNLNGGTNRARTCDPLLVRQVLSQLSYGPILERVKGIEPSQLAWKARTLPLSYTRKYWWLIGESNPCHRRERAVSWPLDQWATLFCFKFVLAPREGLEPSAYRLTAECSTIELPWNITWLRLTLPGGCPPSTISAQELNFCVRNGNRCILLAIITTSFFRQVLY